MLKDRLGSAYATTDATGNVVGEMRYYAFGETRLSTGNMFTDRLYTGQRQIAELGIYHFNARFYSPKLGRFLSADTLMSGFANPQSLNRYSYVGNNPINANDPTGHYCVGDLEGCRDETGAPVNGAPLYLHPDDDGGGGGDPDDDGGGGGGVLPMPTVTPIGTLPSSSTQDPPPPGLNWCQPIDCVLSAVSFFASIGTFFPPPIDAIAFGVDVVATVWAGLRTYSDYDEGKISSTRFWFLEGTGVVGLVPGVVGTGASFLNLLITATGIPG